MSLKSLKRHEGWLMIDHRASPGIPTEMALRMGLDPKLVGEGGFMEAATFTCKHCGCAKLKNPKRTRPRGYCRLCDHYICDACHADSVTPGYVHLCKEAKVDIAMTAASRIVI